MRILSFTFFLLVSITLSGQKNYYTTKPEQTAIKSAYRILKAFYPDRNLCIEDSIYDLDWWPSKEYSSITNEKICAYRPSKNYVFSEPVYEEGLSQLLEADSCTSDKENYYVQFSEPYDGMIRCDLVNVDKVLAMFGIIPEFLFIYNEEGEIYQVTKDDLIAN